MKFAKKTVEIIERELRTTLTAEEIADGYMERKISRFGSEKAITLYRSKYGALNVTAHFENDNYKFLNVWFDKPDAKFIKCLRRI